jgi:beta-xylosidase
VLRDGDDYYMTHSSFEFQPGLLIWHSQDLRSWRPVAHAVVNQEGSIWAPDLVKHDGRYYVYYPAAGTNWVVTAEKIAGPWSKPVSIGVGRIDPGHVADDEGRRYVHLSAGYAAEVSADGLKAVTPPTKVYDGWPIPRDWTIECFCLESPKLTRRGQWYYLTSAQGGTSGPATSHMVVSARSKGPLGPWENSPHNPIIRTWDRGEAWWSKGHGTLVEGPDNRWYCVLHGYMNGYRTLGRCTLIEPIQWTADGWFQAADGWPNEAKDFAGEAVMPLGDEFAGEHLGLQWQFHRQFDQTRYKLEADSLLLNGFGDTPGLSRPLCVMAMHRAYEIETDVELSGEGAAGLMLFGAPEAYIGLSISSDGKLRRVQEGFRRYGGTDEPEIGRSRVTLRIVNDKQDVRFYYKSADGEWIILQPGIDVSSMTTVGWHALRPALFATGASRTRFHYFRYQAEE